MIPISSSGSCSKCKCCCPDIPAVTIAPPFGPPDDDEDYEGTHDERFRPILIDLNHTNNARPSTLNKHQKGLSRLQTDAGKKEKGDARRPDNRSGKRPRPQEQKMEWTPVSMPKITTSTWIAVGFSAIGIGFVGGIGSFCGRGSIWRYIVY